MTANRNIEVLESSHDVTVPDSDGKTIRKIGDLQVFQYGEENVHKHVFVSAQGHKYNLGPTSESFRFTDHTQVLSPLLDNGFKIRDAVPNKGGADYFFTLTQDNPRSLPDPITWDDPIWAPVRPDVSRSMEEMIIVRSSIRPGHAVSYAWGWFRLICTNGLIIEDLSIGKVKYTHTNILLGGDLEEIFKIRPEQAQNILGQYVGNNRGVAKFTDLLSRLSDTEQEPDLEEVPFFIRESVSTVSRTPVWYRESLMKHLELMKDQERVYMLDIRNMTTGALNLSRMDTTQERAFGRIVSRDQSLTKGIAHLIGGFSL